MRRTTSGWSISAITRSGSCASLAQSALARSPRAIMREHVREYDHPEKLEQVPSGSAPVYPNTMKFEHDMLEFHGISGTLS